MNGENKKRKPATLGGIDLDKLNHEIVSMNDFKGQGPAKGIFIPFGHLNPCMVVSQRDASDPPQIRVDVELIELENKLSRWMLKANVRSANKKAYGIDTKEMASQAQPVLGYLREFERNDVQPAPSYGRAQAADDDDDLPPDNAPSPRETPSERTSGAPSALTGDFVQEAPDWTTDL
jgi:hypothetical protein